METVKPNIGVFIGRLQPLHNAHLAVIKLALEEVDHLVIVLGSACQAKTIKNPWTTEEREKMVRACLSREENARVTLVPAVDYLYNDKTWLTELQSTLSSVFVGKNPRFGVMEDGTLNAEVMEKYGISIGHLIDLSDTNVTLYGHDKDRTTYYLHMFPQWTFKEVGDLSDHDDEVDASQAREYFFRKDSLDIKRVCPAPVFDMLHATIMEQGDEYKRLYNEFRHVAEYKAQWADSPFPPIFVTTDAVVTKSGHVLVGRRRGKLGNGLLALPGGFLHDTERIEDGCVRELKEETRIGLPKDELLKRVKEVKVFDHPDRSLRGRTITHAFLIDLGAGALPKVKGDDDMEKARWLPLSEVDQFAGEFFEDHWHIIKYFTSRG